MVFLHGKGPKDREKENKVTISGSEREYQEHSTKFPTKSCWVQELQIFYPANLIFKREMFLLLLSKLTCLPDTVG